jgi:broad specificity phosphatase PhoE
MKTVYFIRHGESEANARGITAGSGLDVGLTKHGEQQAQRLGQTLKDKQVDLIVTSPLKRAADTAAIIAASIGYDPEKIVSSKLFTERYLGDLTGANKELVKTRFDIGSLPANAEKTDQMHERITNGLEWLKTRDARYIVLVSHGGPGRMIRTIIRQEHHSSINTLSKVGNAETLQFTL